MAIFAPILKNSDEKDLLVPVPSSIYHSGSKPGDWPGSGDQHEFKAI
jgi:hypothetical protein